MSLKGAIKRTLLNAAPSLFARFAPQHRKPYSHYWSDASGKTYREKTYARQKNDGEKPLLANPTVAEIREALDRYKPQTVLELGCGWGRLLAELAPHYAIEGCDIADDYLAAAPAGVRVFRYDVVTEEPNGTWDVVFTRAVMMYFINDPEALIRAMRHMEQMARKKVIVWEWPHVAAAMKKAYPSDKFEYQRMDYKDE